MAGKKKLSLLVSELESVQNSEQELVNTGVALKNAYTNGKKTDSFESVVVTALTEKLGEIQIVFPPHPELFDALEETLSFAQRFKLSDIVASVRDVKVSIYDGSLTIKFLCTPILGEEAFKL